MNDCLVAFVSDAFKKLLPRIFENASCEMPEPYASTFAIAGIDLIVNSDNRPFILELNNNPALPGENKSMSELYRKHLVTFVQSVIALGALGQQSSSGCFIGIDSKSLEKSFTKIEAIL